MGRSIKFDRRTSVSQLRPSTLNMAQQVLKYLIPGGERRITLDSVLRAVSEEFQVQPGQLKQEDQRAGKRSSASDRSCT